MLAPAEAIEPKWAWHYRTLLRLRVRLCAQRGEQLAKAAEPIEPHSMDIADSATDEFDHDLALSELSAEQDALYEVEEALSRIRTGTYGTCEETGEKIAAARLRAIPWTRFAKDVETRLELKGIVGRTHIAPAASVHDTAAVGLMEAETPEPGEESEAKDEAMYSVYTMPGHHLHEHTAGAAISRKRRHATRKSR